MFGYIGVYRPELKIKESDTFKAYYCGLCRALKSGYSPTARLLLSYDCTFLYLLCDALSDARPDYSKRRCPAHPLKKRFCAGGNAGYAAAVNVLLGTESLRDHARDGRKGFGILAAVYSKSRKKAAKLYPRTDRIIKESMEKLLKIEERRESDIDVAADAFAEMLGGIFEEIDSGNRALRSLGYNMGRWVYIMDALDDFEKDVRKNNYNPLAARFGNELNDEVKNSAEFNLNASVSGAAMAYDLLDIKKHDGILKNIIYLGLYKKAEEVLGGKGKKADGSI